MFRQIIAFIACVTALNGFAQSTRLEESLDELSNRLINSQEVAGINVLLLKDGKPIYNKAFGYADVATKQPLQTDNIFRIASQTKAVTSVAVMMLWEQGKILLDDPVYKYIPQFKNPKVLDKFNPADSSYTTLPAQREITIRDLLRHTSGIDYPIISGDERMKAIYAKAGVVTGIGNKGELNNQIELLAVQPLVHQPGEAFTYGLNTDVLGYLVEVVSGMPLDDFFRKRIFEPLEMNETYFKIPQDKADRLVSVSEKTDKGFTKVSHPIYDNSNINYPLETGVYFSGGAGLSSTTADYARFLQMLLNKGVYNGKRILGAKTIELMTTNQLSENTISQGDPDFRFGLGFELVTEQNKFAKAPSIGTFSWGGAFNTHYWADPKENIIGLVFTQEYFPTSYNDLGTLYKNVIYANDNKDQAMASKTKNKEQLWVAQSYYEKINAGAFDDDSYYDLFTEDVKLFYPKFGFAAGKSGVRKFGQQVRKLFNHLTFDLDKFNYIISDNIIVVEGFENGATSTDVSFPDNEVSYGKFCTVFEFEGNRIKRMYCYVDPDHAGEDKKRVTLLKQ